MRDITLVMVRHSKSCSNHVRDIAGTHDTDHPLVAASQQIRDPALSAHGAAMARAYGPVLQSRLRRLGLQLTSPSVQVGSSGLRRARETAELLFPDTTPLVHFPHIKEFGNIPENTPAQMRRDRPDFRAFLRHLHTLPSQIKTVIVVAHGSFLRSEAWPIVSPRKPTHPRFGNLDAFVVRTGLTEDGRLMRPRTTDLPWSGKKPTGGDRCSHRVERLVTRHAQKTHTHFRNMRHTKKQSRSRKQRGGATSMPLAWYQPGAQFQGTSAMPTGVGLEGSNASWARLGLAVQGGGRRRTRRQQRSQRSGVSNHLEQMGGFSPSIMGAGFAEVGMRLLPAAAYMGYNQFQAYNKRRTHRRK